LTFIAGANGSGKTTLTRWNPELFKEIPLLDPDAIANTLQASASALFPRAAARYVLKHAGEHLTGCGKTQHQTSFLNSQTRDSALSEWQLGLRTLSHQKAYLLTATHSGRHWLS